MTTDEQIQSVIASLSDIGPHPHVFEDFQKNSQGARAVLIYLYESGAPLSSRAIQKKFQVSAARIAVIVRSLEKKGYIEKQSDPTDRRSFLLTLSCAGRRKVQEMRQAMCCAIEKAIERVGYERLMEAIATFAEVAAMLKEEKIDCFSTERKDDHNT